ncbi:MAG: hypothetical protein ACR2HF_00615 [Methylococcaceae bacterium]
MKKTETNPNSLDTNLSNNGSPQSRGYIANEDLKLSDIPDQNSDRLCGWMDFALSLDGYNAMSSFEACANMANSGQAQTLTELRSALFFEHRRSHFIIGWEQDNEKLLLGIWELIEKIRAKVAHGDLE